MVWLKSFHNWIRNLTVPAIFFVCLTLLNSQAFSQLVQPGSGKFLGCSMRSPNHASFDTYWNQVTVEDAGKWGSVETTRGTYNWGGADAVYNYAISRGFPFKYHNLFWGQQQPSWTTDASLDSASLRAEMEEWVRLVGQRYPQMSLIDVVNEPFNNAPPASYINALGGTGSTGWDWIITAFSLARQHCAPGVKLLINEFNILQNTTVTNNYIRLIDTLKVRGLIDGIGIQCHYFELSYYGTSTLSSNLQKIVDSTGLPIYISEFDINESDNTTQRTQYSQYFPIFWNNPGVKGITMWGYVQSDIWQSNAYLVLLDGSERPAMNWLRPYVENGYFRSHQSGLWDDATSWEVSNGSAWISPAPHIPTYTDGAITIRNGHTINVYYSDTVDQVGVMSGGTLLISAAADLIVKNGVGTDLSVTGLLINSGSIELLDTAIMNIANGGTYTHEQDGGIIPLANWAAGSTCNISGVAITLPLNIKQNFYNFSWNCPYQSLNLSLGWQNSMAIRGALIVTSTSWDHSTASNPANQLSLFDGPGSCRMSKIIVNGFNAALTAHTGNYADTINVDTSITLSGGGLLSLSDDNDGITTCYLNGNFIVSDSAYIGKSNPANTSKFVFNKIGTQNYSLPSNGVTFFGAPNIIVSSGSVLNMGSGAFGESGSFQLLPGATLQSGHVNGINGNITCTGAYGGGNLLNKAANYTFNGSSAQVTGSSLPDTVANLTLHNSAGLTLSGNVVVNGTMDMQQGTLSGGGKILSYGPNGILKYSGTGSQTTSDVEFPASGAPKDLIIANVISGVTLHASRAISGDLSLSYKFDVGANTITAGSVSTVDLTTAYINVNGGGSLRLPVATSTQVLFPIGASGGSTVSYSPVWVTNNGLSDTISVGAITDAATTRPRIKLKWNINGNIQTGVDYTLQFGWNPSAHESSTFGSNRAGNARIFLMTTDTLEMGTGSYTFQFSSAPYSVMRSGITTLGPFAVGKFRDTVTSVDSYDGELPKKFVLDQNYPNPFNPSTIISYDLPDGQFVILKVYDLLGKEVATLVNEKQSAGKYTKIFNANGFASGIYIYRITAGKNVIVKKMNLIK